MEVINTTEEKDGSLSVQLNLTQEEIELFVNIGINKVISDYIEKQN